MGKGEGDNGVAAYFARHLPGGGTTLAVHPGVVPYAGTFGYDGEGSGSGDGTMSLPDYLRSIAWDTWDTASNDDDDDDDDDDADADDAPPYVFEAVEESQLGAQIVHDLGRFRLPGILHGDDDGEEEGLFTWEAHVQLYFGPARSGAPAHWHTDAVNALVSGAKRWLLWGPRDAPYSRVPAAEAYPRWEALRQRRRGRVAAAADPSDGDDETWGIGGSGDGPLPTPLACTQQPGDVMYVPRGWGHLVWNERPSAGYARHFRRTAASWQRSKRKKKKKKKKKSKEAKKKAKKRAMN